LAINPSTPFGAVAELIESIDNLICMTVNPGWAGQSFLPEVLGKIREARDFLDGHGLDRDIAVDGGVNLSTGRQCLEAGANVLGAASCIFGAKDIAKGAKVLRDLLDGWAAQ
jgi:ribulose-phosphate 3-epimerase